MLNVYSVKGPLFRKKAEGRGQKAEGSKGS